MKKSLAGLPEWVSELISKGASVSACLSLYKEIQATEREETAAEREMRKTEIEQTYKLKAAEMEREVRLKELEFKEKEFCSSKIFNFTDVLFYYVLANRQFRYPTSLQRVTGFCLKEVATVFLFSEQAQLGRRKGVLLIRFAILIYSMSE